MSEGLGFYIDVQTGAATALEELSGLSTGVSTEAGKIGDSLKSLSTIDPFALTITQAEAAARSIEELNGFISQLQPRLATLGEANALLESVGRTPVAGSEAVLANMDAQIVRLQEIVALKEQEAALSGLVGGTPLVSRAAAEEQVAAGGGGRGIVPGLPTGGSSGGGFLGGLGLGFRGGQGGLDANAIGQQVGFISKYLLLFEGFRGVEDIIKDSINETIDFQRAVSDLANQLGISRDNAAGLASNLSQIGARSGLAPSEAVALGGQFATTFAGQGNPADLAQQGAQTGGQLALLTGSKDPSTDLRNATAAVQSFNLEAADTNRVLDAATSAAQHFGLANANSVLPGLAQIGDLAAQAGFSVEQMANAIADISSRTGESSDAAAGELRRFLGREGNTAFQQVFANAGINTTQPFQDELSQLSEKFHTLTDQEKGFITAQFGGGRAGAAALVLLEDYGKIQDKANESTRQGGIFQEQYFKRLGDLKGILTVVRSEFDLFVKDLGATGAATGFGLVLESLKPVLTVADDLLRTFNLIPAPIREAGFAMIELVGAAKLLGNLGVFARLAPRASGEIAAATYVPTHAAGVVPAAAAAEGAAAEVSATSTEAAAEIEAASVKVSGAALSGATTVREAFQGLAASIALGGRAVRESALGAGYEAEHAGERAALGSRIGFGGLAIGALIGGAIIDQVARTASGILKTSDKAGDASVRGVSVDDLKNSADALRNDAAAARHSSSGLTGTLTNFVLGDPTGRSSAAAEAQANLADADAKLMEKAINASTATNQFGASLVDLTNTQDAAATSAKNLVAAGYTAQGVVVSIIQKFKDLDFINNQANAIPKGAAGQAAAGGGVAAQELLANPGIYAGLGVGTPGKNTLADIPVQVSATISDYLKSVGLTNADAGTLSASQLVAEKQRVVESIVATIKKHGGSIDDITKIMPVIDLAASQAVHQQFQAILGKGGGELTSGQVSGYLADITAELAAVQTEVGNAAILHNKNASGDLLGATTALSDLKRFADTIRNDDALTTKQKIQDLKQVKVAEQAQQLAVDAIKANLAQVQGALLAAEASPFDTEYVDQINIGALEQQLKFTRGKAARDQIRAQIAQAQYTLRQQNVTDASAQGLSGIASNDTVGQASQQLANDQRQLHLIVSEGVTRGADYYNALKAVNDDLTALAMAKVDNINAIRASEKDPRNTLALDRLAVASDNRVIDATNRFGADGRETTAYADAIKQRATDLEQLRQDRTARQNARRDANVRPGDPLAEARAGLRDAKNTLADDLKGTAQYYQDLKAVHEAELTLAQQIAAQAKQNYLLSHDTTDPVAQALADLRAAQVQLRKDEAKHTGDLGADRLSVEQAQQASQKAAFDQRLQDAETAYQLQDISTQQYLRFLEAQERALRAQLAGMKKGSEGYRQLTDELNSVRDAIQQTASTISGQFNLGTIDLPSAYDVRRAIASSANVIDASTTNNNFEINGTNINEVLNLLTSIFGPLGAGVRTASATRKVAA